MIECCHECFQPTAKDHAWRGLESHQYCEDLENSVPNETLADAIKKISLSFLIEFIMRERCGRKKYIPSDGKKGITSYP